MRLTEPEYRILVAHSPVLIWRAGVDARCDYFNETWLAFTGRTFEEERGDGWASGVHSDDLDRCFAFYKDHFEQREPFEMEYRLRRHDGVYRWIVDRGAPFVDSEGAFAGFIGSCVDVDDRRRAQKEREERDEQALALARGFEHWILGIVGHDIRNPLNAISQSATLLKRSGSDAAAIERNTERIARGVKRIQHIVDDLLDLTRVRRNGIPIATQPADLGTICREIVEEFGLAAPYREVKLTIRGDTRGVWDPHRIGQVISNLVGNGVQHGTPGTPVGVAVTGDGDEVEVSVHSQGEIAGEVMPTLFQAFQPSDSGAQRSTGLGLGLFIAAAIAKAHGAAVDVETSAATGTRFRLRIPRGPT